MARDHLATVLNRQPRFKIVAKAASAAPEPADVQERWPNVAQVDAVLCTCDTDQCLERARQAAPEARLVVMGVRPGKTDVIGLIRAGAHGFILRNASEAAVVGTIQTVAQGTDVLPAPLTSVLWSHLTTRPTTSPPPASPEADASLTKREREVAGLILEGLANKEIGRRLGISTHTVKSHVHNLLDKSGLRTRMEVSAHTWRA